MRLIPLIFLLTAPSFAICGIIDETLKLSHFNSINVAIHDDASNGCWTNTSETKSYALGQLELIGATIDRSNNKTVDESTGAATLKISVIGDRSLENACFGHITIRLEQIALSQIGEGSSIPQENDASRLFKLATQNNGARRAEILTLVERRVNKDLH